MELNLRWSDLRSRYYVQYRSQDSGTDYYSLFADIEMDSKFGNWEVWANLGEINYVSRQLDYFYGYLSNRQDLGNGISWEIKLSHRYQRTAAQKHLTTASVVLETLW